MQASHTALLSATHLPLSVRKAHISPQMQNKALLSLGQFCDNNYEVKLTALTINITHQHDTNMWLTGSRDLSNGMWTIYILPQALPQEPTPNPVVNNVYELNTKTWHNHILTQGRVQPSPINLDWRHKCRLLHRMARPHGRPGQESLTKIASNPQGPYAFD